MYQHVSQPSIAPTVPVLGKRIMCSTIREYSVPKMQRPLLIVGLPGIGLVSKLTADNLVIALKAKRVATLYSPHFPNQVLSMPSGRLRPFGLHLYHAKAGTGKRKRDLLIAKGDLQPLTIEGQYEVSSIILEYFAAAGGRTVLSMAGYATNKKNDKPKLFVSCTHPKLLAKLVSSGAKKSEATVPIVGMAGLIPALAPLFGAHGACILAETPGPTVDATGAIALTEFLSRFTGIKMETQGIFSRAKKATHVIEQFEKQSQAVENPSAVGPVAGAPAPEIVKKDVLNYIR